MPPSEDEIHSLWKLYDEAETYVAEVSSMWDGLDTTAVNQLRYAGRHALNALTGKTSQSPEEEYRRAVTHAKRAIFDALDSGIIYCLQKIELFKSDYRKIEISTPRYAEIIASARRAKTLLDEARTNNENRHGYYQEAKTHFSSLKDACEALEDSRPEQNKRLKAHNRTILYTWLGIGVAAVSLAVSVLAYLKP